MADLTPEEISQVAAALDELKAKYDELTTAQKTMFADYTTYLSTIRQAKTAQEQFITLKQREATMMRESGELDARKLAEIQRQVEANEQMANAYLANQAEIDAALENTRTRTAEIRAEEMAEMEASRTGTEEWASGLQERGETIAGLGLTTIVSTLEGFGSVTKNIKAELVMLGALYPEISKTITASLGTIIPSMDKALAAIPKAMGLVGEETRELVAIAQSLQAFEQIGSPEQIERLSRLGGIIEDVALTPDLVAAAAKSAYENIEQFRPSLVESDAAIGAFLTNFMATYEKMGVTTDETAKLINQFDKVFDESLEGSVDKVKQISSIADSLEISQTRAITNMSSNMNVFAQYGDEQVEVYSKMEAQAQATGMSVNELATYAEQLDTFDTAADAAQGFNAVLGDTYLNFEELAVANHPDKIKLIQDAWARSGKEFQSMDRFAKKAVMSALNLTDVEKTAQLLAGDKGDIYEIRASKIDMSVKSQQQFKEQAQGTLTTMEDITKGLSRSAGGAKAIIDRAREYSSEAANVITNAFKDVGALGTHMEAKMFGTILALEQMVGLTGDIGKSIRGGKLGDAVISSAELGAKGIVGTILSETGATTLAAEMVEQNLDISPPRRPDSPGAGLIPGMAPGASPAGEPGFAEQVLFSVKELIDSMKEGQPIEITTNLNLDGKTIDTISQKTSTAATRATKDELKRRALNLPVVSR